MIRALFRALYRWHLRGQILELELAIKAELNRAAQLDNTLYCWRWEITRLTQKLERAGGSKTKRAQFALAGLRERQP
jgi:hypothetical protein